MNRLSAWLRAGIFCAVGLLLLTPFVHAPGAIEPMPVGKALWSRSLIAIAFALWAPLALIRPDCRPPRAWLLAVIAAGLGVEGLAALAGESLQRSLWSDYERMQGLVDRAHWAALTLVLASVLRRPGDWRALAGANLLVGAAVAATVAATAAGIGLPAPLAPPEAFLPRYGGPFGNPALLSVYMLANLVLAAGFAVRGWSHAAAVAGGTAGRFGGPLLWTAVAALHLAGLVLADSLGAFIGLYAAVCLAALATAALARGRSRLLAASLCAALVLAGGGTAWRVVAQGLDAPGAAGAQWGVRTSLQWPSVRSRLASWETGLRGIAERPLLGWGPENFVVVFGRYAQGVAAVSQSHDRAHNMPIEIAATSGLAGLSLWLARWGLALGIFLGAARMRARAGPPAPARRRGPHPGAGRGAATLYIAAAAALAGHFTQLLTLFDSAGGALVTALLFAWASRLEPEVVPERRRPRWPAPLARAFAPRALGPLLAAAAVAASLAGLAANRAILAAADARYLGDWSVLDRTTDERIERFPPLANAWRYRYFQELGLRWEEIRSADPASAASLLGRANRQAEAAMRAEPANWRLAASLARLYAAVARTDPDYAPAARAYLARTEALAPNRDVFPVLLTGPTELAAQALPGGGVELRWRPGEGAGYHAVSRSAEPGVWEFVHFSYDPAQADYVAGPCPGCRYRIKACRYQQVCTEPLQWPAPAGPREEVQP